MVHLLVRVGELRPARV